MLIRKKGVKDKSTSADKNEKGRIVFDLKRKKVLKPCCTCH